ncbi:MAG TPA: hypothetical protein VK939_15730 [Longimicrobiales bacterium]|nr:hypothetical protein [Longimicrobiales bacterium]
MKIKPSHGLNVVIVALTLVGCVPQQTVHQNPPPCADPLYLRLMVAPPDSLSEPERSRLIELEQACTAARATAMHDGVGSMRGMGSRSWWSMAAMLLAAGGMGLFMIWH